MEIEILARKALEILKSKWGMPSKGFLAGGSLANTIWELKSGNPAVVNDIDIFVFGGKIKDQEEISKEDSLFRFKEEGVRYIEDDYRGIISNSYVKDFYTITSAENKGIFNEIVYKASTEDQSIILNSFDINATRVGYSIEKDKFYWTKDFEEFIRSGELKVSNLQTPSHTAIRIVKKRKELGAKMDKSELSILAYGIYRHFSDINKFRFKEKYFDLYNQNIEELKPYFEIYRDEETEAYLMREKMIETKLYQLKGLPSAIENEEFFISKIQNAPIGTSEEFLFYIRNVYGKEIEKSWHKIRHFYTDIDYLDIEASKDDLEILHRFSTYAPKSIARLKGMKISEQIGLIKKLFKVYREDPIIAISILEKESSVLCSDLDDERNQLLLELSVRKEIASDPRNKVGNILRGLEELLDK